MNDNKMWVLIADDEPQVRSALRLVLRQEAGVAIAGEAGDVEQALELVARQRPNLVLLDWESPERGGVAALAGMRAARPGLKVIALSGRPEARRAAQDAEVDAFVSKGDSPEWLLTVLRAICVDYETCS